MFGGFSEEPIDNDKHCVSHGKNSSYNAEGCNTLKRMVKKQKDNEPPFKPHTGVDHKPKQEEVNAVVI